MTRRSDVRASVRNALQGDDPERVISDVKTAIANELASLSPDAQIRFTEYFDHTYMPDMLLTWGSGKAARERPVFVRTVLEPDSARRDIDQLSSQSPVLLDLDQIARSEEVDQVREVRTAISEKPHDVLLAEITALASVAEQPAELFDERSSSVALYQLVKSNLLPGGRGVLGDAEAESLRGGVREGEGASEEFDETVSTLFAPDAALRLRRSGDLLVWTLDPSVPDHPQLSGKLSEDEIRTLMPIILRNERARDTRSFWRMIGSMIDFTTLESMPYAFEGVDLTPLITENVDRWTAKRVQVSLNAEYDKDSDDEPGLRWSLAGGRLRLTAGPWHLFYASDSRYLKGRPRDGVAARWRDLSELLGEYNVDSVELRGVARTVVISAERSSNVKRDVDQIHELLRDSFHVTDMLIRHRESVDQVALDVEFPEMVLTAEGVETFSILTHAGLTLLGRNRPVIPDENVR